MTATKANSAPARAPDVTFTFVQALAAELSKGDIELPGYPVVVARVQQMLNDDDVDIAKVVTAIGSEPAIASSIVRMANSAALNPRGVPAADLRAAITRVGLNTVRTATVSFAMSQVKKAPDLKGIEPQVDRLWQRSIWVASLSQAIARRLTRLNADAAMLAGLLQGIGKLYILARASKHQALFADEQAYRHVERTWHVNIAVALIESWGFPPDIVEAVRDSENVDEDARGPVSLSDVLMVAALLSDYAGTPETLRALVAASRPFQRLELDFEGCENFMTAAAEDVASLREVLSI
ncbi:MAG TPA: HDOD domain-containing protein [Steroidobacteraceae bacterium]|nr:HDOD domain-containing protein [Steroidobacteraceae bacterium]